jgi:mannose-6-phosphate isomerase-like protein (cupin superfamily)
VKCYAGGQAPSVSLQSADMGIEETTVALGPVTIRYVHAAPGATYSLLQWSAPAGAAAPPVHLHHHTDEGFYVMAGTWRFLVDGDEVSAGPGEHVLVRRGLLHTFWNAGDEDGSCLIILSPAGFEAYFRELAEKLAVSTSQDAALEVRRELSARYDIEVA